MSKKRKVFERLRRELAKGPAELRSLGRPDAAFALSAKIKKVDAAVARLVARMGEAEAEAYLNAELVKRGWHNRV